LRERATVELHFVNRVTRIALVGVKARGIKMPKITLKARRALLERQFAFPTKRKEPLENASHVRNAVARFDQVTGVTDLERDVAWQRILYAAKTYGITVERTDWRDSAHHASTRET
jgi:hypothetical protein